MKLLFLLALLARNPQYNEPFDAIVYAVFISLGFAWIENIVYVTHPLWGGIGTALARAVLSVPGHGLFSVQMGYWLSEAKFAGRKVGWLLAFLVPYLYHGWYNYLLLADVPGAEVFGTAHGTAHHYKSAVYVKVTEKIPISSHRRKIVPK